MDDLQEDNGVIVEDKKVSNPVKDHPTYAIIHAKSNRAKCKHCKKETVKDEYTIFKSFEGNDGHNMAHYYCVDCFFISVMPKARVWSIDVDDTGTNLLKYSGSCDRLDGFSELDITMKQTIINLINSGNAIKSQGKLSKVRTKDQENGDVTSGDNLKSGKKRKLPIAIHDENIKKPLKRPPKQAKEKTKIKVLSSTDSVDEPLNPSSRRSARVRSSRT